ncbi:MAG: GntR family transcriptional regulator [Peptococcaceae bacterium]|nr:GntR family transcriptional regulator [Peptococcaceae bacterium]
MSKNLKPAGKLKTASERVYEEIKNQILSGRLKQGQRLVERDLAKEMQVSRTPVREALMQLEQERLVTTSKFKGVTVARMNSREARDLFQVRAVLEGLAAREAALHRSGEDLERLRRCVEDAKRAREEGMLADVIKYNADFHLTIALSSGNRRLYGLLTQLQDHIGLLRVASLLKPNRLLENEEEHEDIYRAVEKGYPDVAEIMMKQHIWLVIKSIEDEQGDYDKDDIDERMRGFGVIPVLRSDFKG